MQTPRDSAYTEFHSNIHESYIYIYRVSIPSIYVHHVDLSIVAKPYPNGIFSWSTFQLLYSGMSSEVKPGFRPKTCFHSLPKPATSPRFGSSPPNAENVTTRNNWNQM